MGLEARCEPVDDALAVLRHVLADGEQPALRAETARGLGELLRSLARQDPVVMAILTSAMGDIATALGASTVVAGDAVDDPPLNAYEDSRGRLHPLC